MIKDQAEMQKVLVEIFSLQIDRVRFGWASERIQGQPLAEATSKEMDRAFKMAELIKNFTQPKRSIFEQVAAGVAAGATAGAVGAAMQGGSQQAPIIDITSPQEPVAEQPRRGGIFAQIFGSGSGGTVGTRKESGAVQQVFKAGQAAEEVQGGLDQFDEHPRAVGQVETKDAPNNDKGSLDNL